MIDDLKNNVELEISMLSEIKLFSDKLTNADKSEKKIYEGLLDSLVKRIELINDSIPKLLEDVTLTKKLPVESSAEKSLSRMPVKKDFEAVVHKKNRDEFLKELNISDGLIRKLKRKEGRKEKKESEYRRLNVYGKLSNRFFSRYSDDIIKKGKLKSLILNIRRSNINVLSTTYISMMMFSTLIGFAVGLISYIFFIFLGLQSAFPFFAPYEGSYLLRMLKLLWIPFAVPLLVFGAMYLYPGAEKRALGKRIEQELPFVVIHMASISGSGIDPIEILKIVGMSKEYKYAGQEVRKLINQTNIYGYDLSTALRNVALSTPSARFGELLNGMGVTINSGGNIRTFFEKRAESLLLEYRLEREKSTKSAETFMDLYISIVIATPMILLMLLVMVAVSGVQTGFSPQQLTIAIIGIVAIVNILFLTFLHMKQPGY